MILEKAVKNKPYDSSVSTESFESKDYQSTKNVLSKFDFDLYDENKDLVEKVIRIKKVSMPNKGERWKITEDNKVVFTIESTKISKKEKEFLRTADGFNFLIYQYKQGIKSLAKLKLELKKRIKK